MSSLLRSTIPKTDETIDLILGWLTTNAFFDVKKPKKKSGSLAVSLLQAIIFYLLTYCLAPSHSRSSSLARIA